MGLMMRAVQMVLAEVAPLVAILQGLESAAAVALASRPAAGVVQVARSTAAVELVAAMLVVWMARKTGSTEVVARAAAGLMVTVV